MDGVPRFPPAMNILPRVSRKHAAVAAASFVVALSATLPATAANFTFNGQQANADANHWNAPIWQPGNVAPTAGNTYELLVNPATATRLRTPNGTTGSGGTGAAGQTFTFPGDSLTLNGAGFTTGATSTELRFKATFDNTTFNFPGVGGNPGLILNGGILNVGDDRIMTISGSVRANPGSTSSFNPGGQNTTDIGAARGFLVTAGLTGSGTLSLDFGHDFGSAAPALQIGSSNPNFSGDWLVNSGWLKGAGTNSLGTGNITLNSGIQAGGGSTLDLDYDLNLPSKALTLNGTDSKLVVDQALTFGTVSINGTQLAPGLYTAAQLNTQFDTNIVDGGTGSLRVIPEPSAVLAAFLGGATILIRRRRMLV